MSDQLKDLREACARLIVYDIEGWQPTLQEMQAAIRNLDVEQFREKLRKGETPITSALCKQFMGSSGPAAAVAFCLQCEKFEKERDE